MALTGSTSRVALVTGAGRGIGEAASVALAEEGYDLVLVSRTEAQLESTAGRVRDCGRQALVKRADVTDEAAVRALFHETREQCGRLDLLVNNAGWARLAPIEETTLEDWDRHLAINLTGVFLCCREAIPLLTESGHGTIVNVASSSGKKGYETQGAYVAAKHGVLGLTKVLAMELKSRGIHVHAICPGAVLTRMAEEIHPHRDKTGWMTAEDVASAIRFLVTRPRHLTIDEIVLRRFSSDVMF